MSGPRKRKQRAPEGPPPPPVVQRLWIRYTKTGRLRFMSHRDYTRVFERAVRRAGLPIAFSAGFTPHPKISWVGAAPTGVASEAEYLEIGLAAELDPTDVSSRLDAALPPDLDIVEVVPASAKSLADRVDASRWRFTFPGMDQSLLREAAEMLVTGESAVVERLTQNGRKQVDVGSAFAHAEVGGAPGCAIMTAIVRQSIPVVRPDDVYAALRDVAGLVPPQLPQALRLAQGSLDDTGRLLDPLAVDSPAIASSPAS
ncbi:TIGR03936 family radical SAM-associated protein [Blastococcus sp. Marseille-P5729]|uniref:TIGR03936 family radical SAM-associated protein n=1 Tax=Blastococcus sp. Marseille-P5729 TaxID=2086582 RepID=UPI001F362B3D|nr:TIGR03936 family radical SAM-associated protein [Blastococcus sp. Marseille-P5729]